MKRAALSGKHRFGSWWRGTRPLVLVTLLLAQATVAPAQAPRPLQDGVQRIAVNGVEHWVRVAGARHRTTPIVVVHGGPGGNVYNFERTAGRELEAFRTVIYYEQRGSGRSAMPADSNAYSFPLLVSDLEGIREALGLERIVPLGFSFGGELALEYALAHPERVERLVLQAPSTGDWERMQSVQIAGFVALVSGESGQRVREAAHAPEPVDVRWNRVWGVVDTETVDRLLFHDPARARENRRMWQESGLKGNPQFYRALRRQPAPVFPLLERARAARVPTLVLVGLHDRNTGVEASRDLAGAIPGARLVVLQKSAHFPDHEETAAYVQEVRHFLAR